MTDRVSSLTVALKHDTRTDDVEPLVSAIKLLQGVCSVKADVQSVGEFVGYARAREEMLKRLLCLVEKDYE